ncbi:MAG TPA: choice-of-anchor R domain-containing protein [Caulobacteraceae bacterium]|jgi:hypothetical protein|nr:choice-of-anchor R domain-containing protein [Caulobacteraceae bacterium]
MKVSVLAGVALAAGLAASMGAHAADLYNDLGGVSAGEDPVHGFGPLADSFSTGASAVKLTDISVLVSGGNASSSAAWTLSVLADDGTQPGAALASYILSDSVLSSVGSVVTVATSLTLSADTRYWVELSENDPSTVEWLWTRDVSGVGVANEFLSNTGGVFDNADGAPYQMEVSAGAVPEPAAWAMMLVGFGGLGAAVRRRRGRGAVAA